MTDTPTFDPDNNAHLARGLKNYSKSKAKAVLEEIVTGKLATTKGRCVFGVEDPTGCGNRLGSPYQNGIRLVWGHIGIPKSRITPETKTRFHAMENLWPQCELCNDMQAHFPPQELLEVLKRKEAGIRWFCENLLAPLEDIPLDLPPTQPPGDGASPA